MKNQNDFLTTVLYLLENKFYFKVLCTEDTKLITLEPDFCLTLYQFGFELEKPFMRKIVFNEIKVKKESFPTNRELLPILTKIEKFPFSGNLENVFTFISHLIDFNYQFSFEIEDVPVIKDVDYKISFGEKIHYFSYMSEKTKKKYL